MTSELLAVSFDAADPGGQARFWAALLGRGQVDGDGDLVDLVPADDTGFSIRFVRSPDPKTSQNRMHFDLTSTSLEDQRETVDRAIRLGGRHIDVGQRPEEGHVVLADPEGNELCVIEPGNRFLADCGLVGALSCDGSQAVGYFWSRALGWPLVWDQDEETAIRSPAGGPKVTWGGPPLMPRTAHERVHLDVAPADGDLEAEVARLVEAGATRVSSGDGREVLADPDGNPFCLVERPE